MLALTFGFGGRGFGGRSLAALFGHALALSFSTAAFGFDEGPLFGFEPVDLFGKGGLLGLSDS